jgi:hypothetical protein
MGSVCLSVDVYMMDLGGVSWVSCYLMVSFHLRWVLFLLVKSFKI